MSQSHSAWPSGEGESPGNEKKTTESENDESGPLTATCICFFSGKNTDLYERGVNMNNSYV